MTILFISFWHRSNSYHFDEDRQTVSGTCKGSKTGFYFLEWGPGMVALFMDISGKYMCFLRVLVCLAVVFVSCRGRCNIM